LYEVGAAVATKTWSDLSGERMCFTVVEIVVVADIKRRAGARRPAGKKLRAQSRAKRVVVDDRPRKRGARELISAAEGKDVNVIRHPFSVSSFQRLLYKVER